MLCARMRSPCLAILLLLGTPASLSCRAPRPAPEDWLAVGFRTPEQAFESFRTGLRADQPALEYRALSESFRQRNGVSQLAYREFRERAFREHPELRWVGKAEIEGVERLADDRARLRARVQVLWIERRFTVDLVREDYFELWAGAELVDYGYPAFESAVAELGDAGDERIVASIPNREAVGVDLLTDVSIGREWKIDDLPRLLADP